MTKKTDKYQTPIRGVSQQEPHLRRPGQVTEQINMISDPVHGAVRREGSLCLAETIISTAEADVSDLSFMTGTEDLKTFRHFDFTVSGVEYTLFYRTGARATYSRLPAFVCFNRTTSAFVPLLTSGSDTVLDTCAASGFNAIVAAGAYVFLASPGMLPSASTFDAFNNPLNFNGTVWVRGSAYSRTFTVTVRLTDATVVTVSHTTPASSYPTLLDTSDILTSNPDYQKLVNDRVNAYNSAVTAWIGTSSAAVQPAAIAAALFALLAPLMTPLGISTAVSKNHIAIAGTGSGPGVATIIASDGGDGTLIRAVARDVDDAGQLTPMHAIGHIVYVKPKTAGGEDGYYLQAVRKDETSTDGGMLQEVIWRECAGVRHVPDRALIYATPYAGQLAVASSPEFLDTLTSGTAPQLAQNLCGDLTTVPLPNFYGKAITYLGMMQDRLIIGCGAVLNFSKVGDYLNFYRTSLLTLTDDDAMEYFALGSEGDTIRFDAPHDQSLILFGDKRQYRINGRVVLSARSPNISNLGQHEGVTTAPPIASGNYVFFSKARGDFTAVSQVQAGLIAESPEVSSISAAIDTYLQGTPIETVSTTDPSALLLRTTGNPYGLYIYSYLDSQGNQSREFDSWSRWEWDQGLGACGGITVHRGRVLALTYRRGVAWSDAPAVFWAVDSFSLRGDRSPRPQLDSARRLRKYRAPLDTSFNWLTTKLPDPTQVELAFGTDVDQSLIGGGADQLELFIATYPTSVDNAWAGIHFDASLTPTNPCIRDRNGAGVDIGRFTITRLEVYYKATGGATVTRTTLDGTRQISLFEGITVGESTLGAQAVGDAHVNAWPRKERREFSYTIHSDGWLPLTIAGISYWGQHFI